ncbi:alpha/beta hydrolase [Alphaproteobacteria bacterium GH1-50]|uniref:Alpha/beta hydrolase n=1 Tax=Kangsaoukella pontilimi TaxID=2691042 RepID=A0A7C9MWZ6_9RHOB|nr:alpha/beta hydrolase [Kangsaoukella pontilimi]MXQ08014.1 alpha/beta hydrolase [Kangsaoukella pontilimi]
MADSWHVAWLREGVEQWNGRRRKAKFKPDLSGVNFKEVLPSPDTEKDFFDGVNLSSANLRGADLSGLSFRDAKFTYSKLERANLAESDFSGSQFYRANMQGSTARAARFSGAALRSVKIAEVDLSGASFDRAVLSGSDISAEQVLSLESFEFAEMPERILDSDSVIRRLADQNIRLSSTEYRDYRGPAESLGYASSSPQSTSRKAAAEKVTYDVYYGTDRKPIFVNGVVRDYSGDRHSNVDFGVCEVFIPKSHKVGSIGSPLWKRIFSGDDRLKITGLYQLNETIFWSQVRRVLTKSGPSASPTLFVHGYNNSFSQAVIRAAQIGRDLGLGSGIGLFSWPSKGRSGSYSADEASMEASKYNLADFIERFVQNSPSGGLNIIAHSMGCRCFLLALEILAHRGSTSVDRLEQIILAAADVDQGIMTKLGAHAVTHSTRSTCYVSTEDKAVAISEWLHDYPRVGICPPVFVMSGLDTVVVNNTDLTMLGHSYVGSSREVLSDIFHLLKDNAAPTDRFTVEAAETLGIAHWKLKD